MPHETQNTSPSRSRMIAVCTRIMCFTQGCCCSCSQESHERKTYKTTAAIKHGCYYGRDAPARSTYVSNTHMTCEIKGNCMCVFVSGAQRPVSKRQ